MQRETMFTPTYTQKNVWHVQELKRRQDMFKRWFAYRKGDDGRVYAFISEGDHTPPCNCRLVGAADTLVELKHEIRKWYNSIKTA